MSSPFRTKEEFWKNFDLSVVIPFYKKMREFRRVFPLNHKYFQRNGIEVVIVLDTPLEQDELIEFVKDYPFVNWRIVLNDKPHKWRNPAKPLNVGIRHATKKYVMVCSPESEMLTDVIGILRKTFEDYSDFPHYAIGRVCFVNDEVVTQDNFDVFRPIPFGSIMVEKKYLEQIHGYDETFSKWGGDDNNLRARLDMLGIGELYVNEAMMVHREDGDEVKPRRDIPFEKTPNDVMRHYFFPDTAVVNGDNWGCDFENVIYDWRHNCFSKELLLRYLKNKDFVRYEIFSDLKFPCPLLLLVQSYNEQERIVHFLEKASPLFDGIILLDDESGDGTYDIALEKKLLFKVQKKRRGFNDLENRNLLMDLSSFVDFELAVFLDVDEEFDSRFCDLHSYLTDKDTNTYFVPYIHLWNSEDTYNAEYPSSVGGICLRCKMFRNMGHAEIFSDRGKLHFHQVPAMGRTRIADNLLIKHYGLISLECRNTKYDFYKKEDTEHSQCSYEHFKSDPVLKKVRDLTSGELYKLSNNFKRSCL